MFNIFQYIVDKRSFFNVYATLLSFGHLFGLIKQFVNYKTLMYNQTQKDLVEIRSKAPVGHLNKNIEI